MNIVLSNGIFNVGIDARQAHPTAQTALADRLCRFLAPYLSPVPHGASSPDLQIRLLPPGSFEPDWKQRCTQPALIRDTYAQGFTLRVHQGWLDDGRLTAWDEAQQVGYLIDRARREVAFHGGPDAFIHLIELVRYHGLLVEQAHGTAILHSSAVINPQTGGALAIAGIKGAGKTTTMLDRVLNQGWTYFSGDKLLLDIVGGRVRARGWPDFPHIGLGSLRPFPGLMQSLAPQAMPAITPGMPDQQKVLVPPEAFAATVGRSPVGTAWLEGIVLPEVLADGPPRHTAMPRTDILATLAERSIFEWPHTFITSTWHGLPPADQALSAHINPALVEALCGLPWTRSTGRAGQAAIEASVH